MTKVKAPAIKTASGKVVSAKPGKHHASIPAQGTRGFKLSDGAFVGREKGASVAKKAGQVKAGTNPRVLHSHMLKSR